MGNIRAQEGQIGQVIPNFCRPRPLLVLMFAMEMIAVLLTLAGESFGTYDGLRLLVLSVYLQWMGLCGAAVLCLARRSLRIARGWVAFLVSWALLVAVTWVVAEIAWMIAARLDFGLPLAGPRVPFVARQVAIGAVVSWLLLRYFWERHASQEKMQAETEARYRALQARIRPHFLFNALNSVAELIRSRPDTAERMVEDLSDLFRATLEERTRMVSLADELEVVKGYLRIEEVRLGDKLMVNWDVPEFLLPASVPRLTVQPLVENAVIHGISRLRARGVLHVSARVEGEQLVLEVENPLAPEESAINRGTGIAINNIAQRIKLIYGDRARLTLGEERTDYGGVYRARLRVPLILAEEQQEEGPHR